MRAFLPGVLLVCLTGCAQPGMTYGQWKAEQARKARIERVRREATEMSKTSVVFTPEEQAQSRKH